MTMETERIEQNEKLKVQVKVGRYDQDDGGHCLQLKIDNAHVTVTSYPYDHRKGSNTDVDVFDLSTDDFKALGTAIIAEAIKIEMGVK